MMSRAPSAPAGTWPPDRVLQLGDSGADVAQLQRFLGIPVNGVFDRATKDAVIAFQISHGLTSDGAVDKITAACLKGAS
jgi:peptidoglycan hydrolase-like protein with peptidoglycan-binding domain